MKRRLLLFAILIACFTLLFATFVSAEEFNGPKVTLEPIPQELKLPNDPDTLTQFVVISDVRFFSGEGEHLTTMNEELVAAAFNHAGISVSELGTKYLTKIVFPSHWEDGTPITFPDINLAGNGMKTNAYIKNVCGYVEYPSTTEQIYDMNDCAAQLRCVDFGEGNKIKNIPGSMCCYAQRLKYLKNFPTELDNIYGSAFANCRNLAMDEIYLNATNIYNKAFDNALINFKKVTFGPRTSFLDNESLSCDAKAFENNYVNPDKVILVTCIEFQCNVETLRLQTLGSPKGAFFFAQNSGSPREPFSRLSCIILSNEANAHLNGKTNYEANANLSFGFDSQKTYYVYTSHANNDDATTIKYEDFSKNGVKATPCSRCTYETKSETPPIFVAKGYSAKEALSGIAGGFFIDTAALAEWKNFGGDKNVSYGVVIFNPTRLGDGAFFNAENKLNATQGAVQISITSSSFSSVDFMIKNFTPENYSLELVIAGYVIADGEVHLIQKEYALSDTPAVSNVTREGASLYTVTMSTVAKRQSITVLPEFVKPTTPNDEE